MATKYACFAGGVRCTIYIICEITKSVYIEVIIILHTQVLFIMHLYVLYEYSVVAHIYIYTLYVIHL